ncbi:MAG: hypothetical protein ACYSUI_21430 [Planctomycetota bacterium]|jgi:hypothetical protein
MSYYTGQGDYYSGKGDPGLFGSIFSGIKGAVGGFLKGGPLGAIKGGISGVIGRPQTGRALQPPAMQRPQITLPGLPFGPQRAPVGAPAAAPAASGNGCTPGYHLNKAYSYRHNAEPGTMCVRNRRMNPANPKALRRAIRREKAFIGLARTALRGTGYKISRAGVATRKKACR